MMRSHSQIVVLTTQGDAHLPFVERHLAEPLIVIDPYDLVNGKGLTYDLRNDKQRVFFDNKELKNVTGVWYRKPQPIVDTKIPVQEAYKPYSQGSLERMYVQLLTAFPDATWMSDYYAQTRANNKTLQMQLARELGFNVPATVVTSDSNAAQAFMDEYSPCISKPLTIAYPKVNGQQKLLLTTLIDEDFRPNLQNLHLAPAIFQEAIDVKLEARVIVVGDQVFTASVTSAPPTSDQAKRVRDNRLGHYEGSVHIGAIDLPPALAKKCILHTKKLGLHYGALDLALSHEGRWWFFENNPNGQWAYIEAAAKWPIGKAIAELLSREKPLESK